MGRYVPPALRKKSAEDSSSAEADKEESTSPTDTAARSLASLELSSTPSKASKQDRYTLDEVHDHYRPKAVLDDPDHGFTPCPASSLNNSVDIPDGLAYVMLFPYANPKWDSDSVIYAKSNLELLPGLDGLISRGWTDGGASSNHPHSRHEKSSSNPTSSPEASSEAATSLMDISEPTSIEPTQVQPQPTSPSTNPPRPLVDYASDDEDSHFPTTSSEPLNHDPQTPTHPIAVFRQLHRGYRTVVFLGYHRLQKITYLRPNSPALIRMLETKFGGTVPDTTDSTKDAGGKHGNADESVQPAHKADENAQTKKASAQPGPASRTSDAWSRSLAVPWAVIKLAPTPVSSDEPNKEVADFWSDTAALQPPTIATHAENDHEHYKRSRDEFKVRRAWRERGGRGGRGGWGGRGGNMARDVRLDEGSAVRVDAGGMEAGE